MTPDNVLSPLMLWPDDRPLPAASSWPLGMPRGIAEWEAAARRAEERRKGRGSVALPGRAPDAS